MRWKDAWYVILDSTVNKKGRVLLYKSDDLLNWKYYRKKRQRTGAFAGHNEIKCRFESPEIHEGERLDIYVSKNLIEIYINNGEYVLSNVVYGLANKITAKSYELYAVAE